MVKDVLISKKYHRREWSVAYQLAEILNEDRSPFSSEQLIILDALTFITSHRIQKNDIVLRHVDCYSFAKFEIKSLDIIENIINHLDDIWLTAKFYDFLWSTKCLKDTIYITKCISAYLQAPISIHTMEYWERGLFLAGMAKLNQDKKRIIKTLVYAAISHNEAFAIADILNKNKAIGECHESIISTLTLDVSNVVKKENFSLAIKHWDLIIDIANKNKQLKKDKNSYIRSKSEVLRLWGEHCEKGGNLYGALNHYREAIIELRRLNNDYKNEHNIDETILLFEQKLVVLRCKNQERSRSLALETKVDLSDSIKEAESWIHGETLYELCYIPDLDYRHILKIHRNINKKNQSSFFRKMIGSVNFTDSDGRLLGSLPSNSKELDKVESYRIFAENLPWISAGYILPALKKFKQLKALSEDDFYRLTNSCPIIPPEQKMLMTKALWHGYNEDFASSIMLLSPLSESILRNILKESEIPTVDIEMASESEKSMNKLLDMANNKNIFNRELTFKIEAIFVNKFGLNFRNKAAHGLVSDSSTNSLHSVYVWWLCLKWTILYSPLLKDI